MKSKPVFCLGLRSEASVPVVQRRRRATNDDRAVFRGRRCHVGVDPVVPIKAFFDIGGAGRNSDAMAMDRPIYRSRDPRPGLHRGHRPATKLHAHQLRSPGSLYAPKFISNRLRPP